MASRTIFEPAAFRNIPRRDRCDQDRASARGKVRVIMAVTPTLLDKWNILQAIVADTLPASAKVIAARLLEHRNGHSGRCFPSIPTLAAGVDMSDDTARRAVRALKRRGWISISRRAGQSHLFEFDWSRLDPSRTCEATPHESARGTPPESATREAPPAEGSKKPRKPKKTHRPWQPGTDWTSDDGKIVPATLTDRCHVASKNLGGWLEEAVDTDGWMRRDKGERAWPMLLKGIATMLSKLQAEAVDNRPREEVIRLKPWTKLRRDSPELAQMIWKLFEQDMRDYGHSKEYYRNGDALPGHGLPPHVRTAVREEALQDDQRGERYRKRLRMPGGGR